MQAVIPTTILSNNEIVPGVHTLQLVKPKEFSFVPGQFIVIEGTIKGKRVRRSYSIASGTNQDHLEVTVRSQEKGTFSPWLCKAQEGTELAILGPYGIFILEESNEPTIFIAAGTGITPFISYLRSTQKHDNITLITSNRSTASILYKKELETYNIRVIHALTREQPKEWNGHKGRINKELLKQEKGNKYYLCGPTPMINNVNKLLEELEIKKTAIHKEKYGQITA